MKDLDSQLQGVQTAAIAGHVRPDGDCVGSCLATYNYIKDNYPQIQVDLYLEPIPNIFKFLSVPKRSSMSVQSMNHMICSLHRIAEIPDD